MEMEARRHQRLEMAGNNAEVWWCTAAGKTLLAHSFTLPLPQMRLVLERSEEIEVYAEEEAQLVKFQLVHGGVVVWLCVNCFVFCHWIKSTHMNTIANKGITTQMRKNFLDDVYVYLVGTLVDL